MQSTNICIIPARAGSKRLPGKNTKYIGRKPIIEHSINLAIRSNLFEKIILSTDDPKILKYDNYFNKHKLVDVYKRPAELAGDKTPLIDVCQDVMEKTRGIYDNVCLLYPCAPLVQTIHLRNSLILMTSFVNTVCPVVKNSFPEHQQLFINENGNVHVYITHDDANCTKYNYHHAGSFFWIKAGFLKTTKSIMSGYVRPYIMPELYAQDVNTQEDWDLLEAKYYYLKHIGKI